MQSFQPLLDKQTTDVGLLRMTCKCLGGQKNDGNQRITQSVTLLTYHQNRTEKVFSDNWDEN